MSLKKIVLLIFLPLAIYSSFSIFAQENKSGELTILFTNSSNGRLNACPTCPNLLNGGMPRRAAFIKEMRKKYRNILVLDSGDLFPVLAPQDQAEYAIKAVNLMGYDAIGLGDQEFMYGKEALKELMGKATFPFLSATIAVKGDSPDFDLQKSGQSPLFTKPYIIKDIGGFKILIASVVNDRAFLFFPKEKIEGLVILDPAAVLKKIIADTKGKADIVVVLSHLGDEGDEKLAKEVEGIDIIVGGHTQTLMEKPLKSGNAVIVQAGKNGEYAGRITLTRDKIATKANLVQFPGQSTYKLYIQKKDYILKVSDYKLTLLNDKVSDDTQTAALVAEYDVLQEAKRLAATAAPETAALKVVPETKLGRAIPFIMVPDELDWGEIEKGRTVESEIPVRNIGSDTLVLRKIRASCECISALPASDSIQPLGESGIKLFFFSEEVLGETFIYNLYIETNDPTQQVSSILITGRVKRPVIEEKIQVKSQKVKGKSQKFVTPNKQQKGALQVMYFYSPGCRQCEEIRGGLLPGIRVKYGGAVEIKEFDISKKENYEMLVGLEEKYGIKKSVPMEAYVGGRCLLGSIEIKKKLEKLIEEELAAIKAKKTQPLKKTLSETFQAAGANTESVIARRFRSFGPFAVIAAGLIDGINPCAFATIIFFISFLTYAGRSKRDILLNGIFFAAGVFAAYYMLGVGLFKVLQSISAFKVVSSAIFYAIFAVAVFLGCMSLYDAYIYKKTGDSSRIALQLPRAVKESIHFWIRKNINAPLIIAGAFFTGLLVSLLEAVCTGQIYIPTIAFMTKDPALAAQAYFYLFLYNLMFIIPLIIVFLLAYFGVGSKKFAEFSQKNIIPVKIITAIFFFSLAALLLILK